MKLETIDRICEMVQDGDKIAAIKLFRAETGWGLKDSKDYVVGTDGRQNWEVFHAKACREFLTSPGELLAEFKVYVHKLEQIIAQFAELCDGFQAETPPPTPPERVWTGDWRVLQVGDAVKYRGLWHDVTAVESPDYDGVMPIAIRSSTSKEFWLQYQEGFKDFQEVILK